MLLLALFILYRIWNEIVSFCFPLMTFCFYIVLITHYIGTLRNGFDLRVTFILSLAMRMEILVIKEKWHVGILVQYTY
jgi:hypothetical protein